MALCVAAGATAVVRRPVGRRAELFPRALHVVEALGVASRVGVRLAQHPPVCLAQLVVARGRRDAEHLIGRRVQRAGWHRSRVLAATSTAAATATARDGAAGRTARGGAEAGGRARADAADAGGEEGRIEGPRADVPVGRAALLLVVAAELLRPLLLVAEEHG